MNITRNVITDLLPVYLSGEASPDTTTLVEEFLRENPDLSIVVEAHRQEFGSQKRLLKAGGPHLPADHEIQTLARTRALMERQKWSMALALMLTALPLSFTFGGGHLTFMILRDQPILAIASLCGAAVFWVQYCLARQRLRVAGLYGPQGRKEAR